MPERPFLAAASVCLDVNGKRLLNGVHLTAHAGQVTALLGSNGAGKTTLIRCCVGLLTPNAGHISVLGDTPGSPRARAGTGLMPQAAGAWSGIRAGELLRYLGRLYPDPRPVDELIEVLHLSDTSGTPYRRLSGGQQQLVNLAGALIGRPDLLILDEPSAGLDPHARRRVAQVIADQREAGVAVVLATHDMREAEDLADHVTILHRGRVAADAALSDLTADADLESAFLRATEDR